MTDTPSSPAPAAETPVPQIILLSEHASAPNFSTQRVSGLLTLALIFFASASFTVAYLSPGANIADADGQAAAAAAAVDPFAELSLQAEGAYVYDLAERRLLYEKNADVQLPLASLVKVPLMLAVSEGLDADSYITIPPHDTFDGTVARLSEGLRFRVRDLIDFTLVASSNEGASILAQSAEEALRAKYPAATNEAAVLWRMNDIAKNLGLERMVFHNVTGLDRSDTQASAYGSARDVAALFGYAAAHAPGLFEYTSRDSLEIRAATGETVSAVNTDNALPAIPGLIMGKTGSTVLAGGNLAVVFELGPAHPVIAVALHSTYAGRFEDMEQLVAASIASIGTGR